jgi:hypothetical protein
VAPGRFVQVAIPVAVAPDAPQTVLNEASIVGGGAGEMTAATSTDVSDFPAAFGFVSGTAGLNLTFTGTDGAPATQAGAHPDQLTAGLGFSTALEAGNLISAEHPRAFRFQLPPGITVDPKATPVLCSEAQLESFSCPDASAIGLVGFQAVTTSVSNLTAPLYNMVPPPGTAIEFGFDPVGIGIFIHILGDIDTAGGYGLSLHADNFIARELNPPISVQLQLWGNPSNPSHDGQRGQCGYGFGLCPVEASPTPFLSMPGSCAGAIPFSVRTESWERPGRAVDASSLTEDSLGNPLALDGCNKLGFAPSLEARPTTGLTDSPTGLELNLHLPQTRDIDSLAAATLRDTRVTLPEGMALNPSFAAGSDACSQAQVALSSAAPADCPDAAKIGNLEVSTPLLDRPLSGAVYLARPFENPFRSPIALYLAIDDRQSGIVVKLPGKVEADPQTGRLSVTFVGAPQLPFEDLRLRLFGGPRAPLRSAATCAPGEIAATLTPWSAPEGADAHLVARVAAVGSPSGGPCPMAEPDLPSKPSFAAGTVSPRAGAGSPFVLKLGRDDATRRLGGLEVALPEGLLGRLAGVSPCSEAAISRARDRGKPGQGALERTDPSCPAASELGVVDVGAGAGIAPLYLGGRVYLAGPYKGSPLSLVTITPAAAGPFDLGAVVVRVALALDPETTRIHAVSDPFPRILGGIPLDLRSIVVRLTRPGFVSNPTSCEPSTVRATASTPALATALSSPFQVGGCRSLGFEPKLSLRLSGGSGGGSRPSLRAALGMPRGSRANLAAIELTLPRSLSIARDRFGGVCTRARFDAGTCPASSIHGHASARTPLLDAPLRGPLYLRASGKGLPELVARLRGSGLEAVAAGGMETVGGRLRIDFDALPDAPLSKLVFAIDGGRDGLLSGRTNLCEAGARASAGFSGQNGAFHDSRPVLVVPSCEKRSRRGGSDR